MNAPEGVDADEWAEFVDGVNAESTRRYEAIDDARRHLNQTIDMYRKIVLYLSRIQHGIQHDQSDGPELGEWLRPVDVWGVTYWRRDGITQPSDPDAFQFTESMRDEYHARRWAMQMARDTDGDVIDPRYRSETES